MYGVTKHGLLFPEDPRECFEVAAAAFDLADRLQTPVFVMSDLDIGMTQRLCAPFAWDDARAHDRGQVMTVTQLEAAAEFARSKADVRDGIPWRPSPRSEDRRVGEELFRTLSPAWAPNPKNT